MLRCRARRLWAGRARTPCHAVTPRPSRTHQTGLRQQTQASRSGKLSQDLLSTPRELAFTKRGVRRLRELGAAGRFPGPRVFRCQTLELE